MQRIVAWILGVLLAFIILAFMISQFSTDGDNLITKFIENISFFRE